MDKQTMEEYSKRYKSVQKKLSIGVMIFIVLIGGLFLGFGIYFCLKIEFALKIVGIIMVVAGFFNIFLGVRFNIFSQKNLREMPPKEAAKRYCKITGK